MITKAIVEEILTPYSARVRVPIFDAIAGAKDATETQFLSTCAVCGLPKQGNTLSVGDVVYVSFEDNDISKPVIIGHLVYEQDSPNYVDLTVRLFTTTSTTKLNEDTYIGEILPKEIKALKGITGNIQRQLNILDERIKKLEG